MGKYTVQQINLLKEFQCTGDKCPDTCCKGWGMQLDDVMYKRYRNEKEELLSAVVVENAGRVMRRDPKTHYCIKFDSGLCGIHSKYGDEFLGDACFFYPRVTKKFGDDLHTMSATLSCPEIARIALYGDSPYSKVNEVSVDRVPESIRDYLPSDGKSADVDDILQNLILVADDEDTQPEISMMKIVSTMQSLKYLEKEQWGAAIPFYLRTIEERFPNPEVHDSDPYKLFHALFALAGAAKIRNKEFRLNDTIDNMADKLDLTLEWSNLTISNNASDLSSYQRLKGRWGIKAEDELSQVLRRWIQAQLSMISLPFIDFDEDITDRAMIIGVRFTTIRLALMCSVADDGTPPDSEQVVFIIQSISRLLDHIGDPTLSINLYKDAGWNRESRMYGLLSNF